MSTCSSQTSPEPTISPDPSVYLHGPETGAPDVQVVWRADLGEDPKDWCDMVATCPPSAAETLAVPIYAVRRWLAEEDGGGDLADIEGEADAPGRVKGTMRTVLKWRGPEESEPSESVLPGMTIVAPSEYGGCDQWGWNPDSAEKVRDIGDAVKSRMGRPMLRLDAELAKQWGYAELATRLRGADSSEFDEILQTADAVEPWVGETLEKLRAPKRKAIGHPKREEWAALVGRAVFSTRTAMPLHTAIREKLAWRPI